MIRDAIRPIRTIAGKEFRDRIRNRWVLGVTATFAVFALAIAFLGSAQQGSVGVRGIQVTVASLVSLAIYLVPLVSLILGFDAIVGERERGSLDVLLSMPVTRLELIIGKYVGLSIALAASLVGGFGIVGVVLAFSLSMGDLVDYGGFVVSTVLLGMSFLSLAVAVSVLAADRTRASGMAIALWLFFVLIFDLLLLAALVATGGQAWGSEALPLALLLNPADVFRVLNIFGTEDMRQLYGLTTVLPERLSQPDVLTGVMVLWIVAPLAFAIWRFEK